MEGSESGEAFGNQRGMPLIESIKFCMKKKLAGYMWFKIQNSTAPFLNLSLMSYFPLPVIFSPAHLIEALIVREHSPG